ncbi:class I SAM-dependent methyltransferase [bacterium]|nr:class I SAM-dependent methyltransferase [bacterium]
MIGRINHEVKTFLGKYFPGLPDHTDQRISRYFEILEKWNRRINLTGIARDQWLDRIVSESLILLNLIPQEQMKNRNQSMWMDMGTGGGIPGLLIASVFPDQPIVLIDSRSRKTDFLNYAVEFIGLPKVRIITDRLENVKAIEIILNKKITVFFSRALADPVKLIGYAGPYSQPNSILISPRSGSDSQKRVNLSNCDGLSWRGQYLSQIIPGSNRRVQCLLLQRED